MPGIKVVDVSIEVESECIYLLASMAFKYETDEFPPDPYVLQLSHQDLDVRALRACF